MYRGDVRKPRAVIVPLMLKGINLEQVTEMTIAATYFCPVERVRDAICAAQREGYIREDNGIIELTMAGREAVMTRGGARVPA